MWWFSFAFAIAVGSFSGSSYNSGQFTYSSFVATGNTIYAASNQMCVDRAGVFLVTYEWCGTTNGTFSVVTPSRTFSDRASAEFTCRSGCVPAYMSRGECAYANATVSATSSWSMVDWNFTSPALYSLNSSNNSLSNQGGLFVPQNVPFYALNPHTNARSITQDVYASFAVNTHASYFYATYFAPSFSSTFDVPYPQYGYYFSSQLIGSMAVQNSSSYGFASAYNTTTSPLLIPSFLFGTMIASVPAFTGTFDFMLSDLNMPYLFFTQNQTTTSTSLTPNMLSLTYLSAYQYESYFYTNQTTFTNLQIKTAGNYLVTIYGVFTGQQNNATSMWLQVGSQRYAFSSLTVGSYLPTYSRALMGSAVVPLAANDLVYWYGNGSTAKAFDSSFLGFHSLSFVLLDTLTPTSAPSNSPTLRPTTGSPSKSPSRAPSKSPTARPSVSPTLPTRSPTTKSPTRLPTTKTPSNAPTLPTRRPTTNAYDPGSQYAAVITVAVVLSVLSVSLVSCLYIYRPR